MPSNVWATHKSATEASIAAERGLATTGSSETGVEAERFPESSQPRNRQLSVLIVDPCIPRRQ
jgi:hypothetical protein